MPSLLSKAQVASNRPAIVISQVYGGGGNIGAIYKHDFVELFNRGATTVNLTSWSLQYAGNTGSFSGNNIAFLGLTGSIAPGGYYLIQLASSSETGSNELPAPDLVGSINMAAAAGKVALASSTNIIEGPASSNVVDFVGYGNSNQAKGSNVPTLSATTSAIRRDRGCTDTGNNQADFTIGTLSPRTTATEAIPCGASLVATPANLDNFVTTSGTNSDEQSYLLSASGLSADITVTAPNGFQLSTTSGTGYQRSLTIPLQNGVATATIYVVLDGTAPVGAVAGNITNTSGDIVEIVALKGSVVAPNSVAQTVRWTGGAGTASWFDAMNWNTGVVPGPGADVILDNTTVKTGYSVLLLPTDVTTPTAVAPVNVRSLTIWPNAGPNDSIFFAVPVTNLSGDALTLTRANADETALAIYPRGVVINETGPVRASGATTGAGITVAGARPTVYIYNGGTYRHYTDRPHATVVENLAPVAGTELGIWEFRAISTGSYSLSLSNRSYPTLVLRNRVGFPTSGYPGSGASLTIRGDLRIGTGVTFTPNISGDFRLAGNLMNQGNFRMNPISSASFTLNGTRPQTISGTAFGATNTANYLGANVTLHLNNTSLAGLTLATPVQLNKALLLTTGRLNTDAVNKLALAAGATIAGSSASSFVNGPMLCEVSGRGTLLFPVGQGSTYRPLTLRFDELRGSATFLVTQQEGSFASPVQAPLTRVNHTRYFTIEPTFTEAAPAFVATITVAFGPDDKVTNPEASTLVLARHTSSGWQNLGRSASSGAASNGAYVAGTLSAPVSDFGRFALASADPATAQNPLPVELTTFRATRNTTETTLRWTTASELNCAYFEVLRQVAGQPEFVVVGSVLGNGTTTQTNTYQFVDKTPTASTAYKLRQVDTDGATTYSPVVTITAGAAPSVVCFPNPVRDQLTLLLAEPAEYKLLTSTGQLLQQGRSTAGNVTVATASLPAGVYLLEIIVANQPRSVQRIIKTGN